MDSLGIVGSAGHALPLWGGLQVEMQFSVSGGDPVALGSHPNHCAFSLAAIWSHPEAAAGPVTAHPAGAAAVGGDEAWELSLGLEPFALPQSLVFKE